jgi:N-methylhydantoinase A/oxoprolinase/acetone carboxylase beta subunit
VLHIFEHTEIMPTPVAAARVNRNLDLLEQQAKALMASEGIAAARQSFEFSLDVRHKGQINEVELLLPWKRMSANYEPSLRRIFVERYEKLYGRGSALAGAQLEIVVCRLRARALTPRPKLVKAKRGSRSIPRDAVRMPRSIQWEKLRNTAVYDGERLAVGNRVSGPAIVEDLRHHGRGPPRPHARRRRARELRDHLQVNAPLKKLNELTGLAFDGVRSGYVPPKQLRISKKLRLHTRQGETSTR